MNESGFVHTLSSGRLTYSAVHRAWSSSSTPLLRIDEASPSKSGSREGARMGAEGSGGCVEVRRESACRRGTRSPTLVMQMRLRGLLELL
jgi:hypothetical protein